MKQLVYRSQPFGFDRAMLAGILLSARRNNRRDGITGALICRHDLYLQLIEGPGPAIDALYAKIVDDDRHSEVRLLSTAPTSDRLFPHWEMLDDEAPSLFWSPAEGGGGRDRGGGTGQADRGFCPTGGGRGSSRRRILGSMPAGLGEDGAVSRGGVVGAPARRVLILGATGTIGRATVRAMLDRGHEVVCLVRGRGGSRDGSAPTDIADLPAGAVIRIGDVTDPASLARDGLRGERFDAIVSCLASRTGAPRDAWAIDYHAHLGALEVARAAGIPHMVLLSAICVQKPVLAFQHAKLAFERALIGSGLTYSIVRPTAFFKSLSGQIDRVTRGKPYLLFGDGDLTACKPISDRDLGTYLAECLDDDTRYDRVLPIGGPGEAITPMQQGERLFALLGRPARFRQVPVTLFDAIIAVLATLGRLSPAIAGKAELARIGRYYATESMLVLDPATGQYDAHATPSAGSDTLFDYYAQVIAGKAAVERGDHAVF